MAFEHDPEEKKQPKSLKVQSGLAVKGLMSWLKRFVPSACPARELVLSSLPAKVATSNQRESRTLPASLVGSVGLARFLVLAITSGQPAMPKKPKKPGHSPSIKLST